MRHHLSPGSLARTARRPALAAFALGAFVFATAGVALSQDSDQQIRCMQLQQELASTQGGGANAAGIAALDQQIAAANRVFQGTKAAMDDAGCFERFFIFGQGLVRNPKCLAMNDRMEDARRQLDQLQGQRAAIAGGSGNRRRQADLQDALARNGCGGGGAVQQTRRDSGGGFFSWFGGGGRSDEEQTDQPAAPVYRSIDPNGRYRSVCVRTCDGFFFPISYSTYSSQLSKDATVCQSSCAAPAELYVYRNPGGEMEQAISLNGTAYSDLPNAFKYRQQYVKGCSCKEAEYNPTEIEAADQKAEAPAAAPGAKPTKQAAAAKTAAAPAAPAQEPAPEQPAAPLDLGSQAAEPGAPAPEAPGAEVQQSGAAEQTPPPPQ